MNPPKPAKMLRLRKIDREDPPAPPRPDARPRRSATPWHGFGPGDWPRQAPLPRCPSARCRRARQCLAAVNGLYCQRTHYSAEEQAVLRPAAPLARALAAVPPVIDPDSLSERMERIAELAAIRRAHDRAMKEQWKAGLLDARFGPYRAAGVVLAPPPRCYVDETAKRGGQGGRGAVESPPLARKRRRNASGLGD